jgi:hypothetical protein
MFYHLAMEKTQDEDFAKEITRAKFLNKFIIYLQMKVMWMIS